MLLHLVRSVYPNAVAVFVDTGLEFPELRNFVKTIDNVVWVKPKMNFKKVIEKYGYPVISKEVAKAVYDARVSMGKGRTDSAAIRMLNGTYYNPSTGKKSAYNKAKWKFLLDAPFQISHKCCDVMKKNTVHAYEKETGNKAFIGTMTEESRMRKAQWMLTGCNSFDAKNPASKPLSFWTGNDILHYIKKYDLDYASVYGDIIQDENGNYHTTGLNRTGCIYCAYGCHMEDEPNRFQRLKETHPTIWNYCMKPVDDGGLGMKEVLEYIDIKIE